MMKKALALVLCALLALTAALAEGYTAPEAGSPLTLEGDMGLVVDGAWYGILNDYAALEGALGEADDCIAAPSCVFKGDDKEFVYDGMSIFTNPLGDMDVWFEAYITGGSYTTPRGIGIGATREAVIAAYGEGYFSEGEGKMNYSVSGEADDYASPSTIFTVEDGVVTCIDIYYPTNTL